MTVITKIELNRQHHTLVAAFRLAGYLAALTLVTALPSYAWTYYSGASVGSDGTVYGWGVTDVMAGGMYHMAYITTTLTSPVKYRQAYGSGNAQNSVRDDVALAFDPADTGVYLAASSSSGFCYMCYCWILQDAPSQASTTMPFVVLTLRNSGTVSTDNSQASSYSSYFGTSELGTLKSPSDNLWVTGVEVVGYVHPSFYTGLIKLKREIGSQVVYNGCTVESSITTATDDTSGDQWRDDDPQSGGSGGKVYDLAARGRKRSFPDGEQRFFWKLRE